MLRMSWLGSSNYYYHCVYCSILRYMRQREQLFYAGVYRESLEGQKKL